jgi:hypothetical protein
MAVVQVNIPEKLWERLQQTGRPIEEIVVEALEEKFEESPEADPKEPSRETILQQLEDAGYLSDPDVWDGPDAQSWRELPEEEKERYFREMDAVWLPDSAASRFILENRR